MTNNAGSTPSSFHHLGIDKWLLRNITDLQYKIPTQVQVKVIPMILSNKSVIAISKTGTGKTASFCLPLLQLLSKDPFSVFAIILEPTRELALQVLEKLKVYANGFNLRVSLIIGGCDYTSQCVELDKLPHIIIATPGRLKDLLENNSIALIENLRFLILDEFDQLLNETIQPDIEDIVTYLPHERKTLFFSATMSMDAKALDNYRGKTEGDIFVYDFNKASANPDSTSPNEVIQINKELEQRYILLHEKLKDNYILFLMRNTFKQKVTMIFVSTYKQCNFLYHLFRLFDLKVSALHSKMPQKERINNLMKFKSSHNTILIATDIASRGLDIPICDLVINYDLPRNPDDYIHRAGRTARAGKSGLCVSMVSQHDVDLILAIEERINTTISEMEANEEEIMSEMSLVSQGVKLAKMKIYESGFDSKSDIRKKHSKLRNEERKLLGKRREAKNNN